MKVVHVSYHYDPEIAGPEALLEKHYTVTGLSEALQRAGAETIVMNRFHSNTSLVVNNVTHIFFNDGLPPVLTGRKFPKKFLQLICQQEPDIVHLHDLSLSMQTYWLRRHLPAKTGIVIQHHGGPAPKGFKKWIHDYLNRVADGYFFTSIEQGKEWFKNKKQQQKLIPVMEGASFFDFPSRDKDRQYLVEREKAQSLAKVTGQPVFVWVGRLDENKDPLTVLNGFEQISADQPNARLYMIYSDAQLLKAVQTKISSSPVLEKKVVLVGKVDHGQLDKWYQTAHYYLAGSHREGSGYALAEAMSCGCVPIVADIPSFRAMTDNGAAGTLWKPGDPNSFAEACRHAMKKDWNQEAERCVQIYKEQLSFSAIADKTIRYYQQILNARHHRLK